MYIPAHFAADDAAVRDLLARHGAADLVTLTADGLLATMLPFAYEPAAGEHGALLGHVARNNDQWRKPALGESLAIVREPDAYVSPSWYAAKAEHGRVVGERQHGGQQALLGLRDQVGRAVPGQQLAHRGGVDGEMGGNVHVASTLKANARKDLVRLPQTAS